jgi:rRNA-processing protein FCF1
LQRVIFDSSFLMAVAEAHTTWSEDMLEEIGRFEPTLLGCVRTELERIAAGGGRKARNARVALSLASKFTEIPCGRAPVDDEIVSAAMSIGALVATSDAALARTLRATKVKVFSLSQRRVVLR